MRAIVQRVLDASVVVSGEKTAEIGQGLVILLGVGIEDTDEDAEWLSTKIAKMRIFAQGTKGMDSSIVEAAGGAIVVSQFTLFAQTKKGNRPSFLNAAKPEVAEPLYERFCELLQSHLVETVGRGVFGADMKVNLTNDGPVTILIDSRNRA